MIPTKAEKFIFGEFWRTSKDIKGLMSYFIIYLLNPLTADGLDQFIFPIPKLFSITVYYHPQQRYTGPKMTQAPPTEG